LNFPDVNCSDVLTFIIVNKKHEIDFRKQSLFNERHKFAKIKMKTKIQNLNGYSYLLMKFFFILNVTC